MLKPYFQKKIPEAGCDEAGRGCLAGPVVAAAVILPVGFTNKEMNDSKKLSHAQRIRLRDVIKEKALAWCIASADNHEIDEINILNASFLAMHRAVDGLSVRPQLLLIDGNRFKPYPSVPHHCIIQGDGIYMSIAAASILAKTHRDELMDNYHEQFPQYSWASNKGYATASHKKAVFEFGVSPLHRKTFHLSGKQMKMEF